jgi:uncharacterized membrane protein
MMFGNSTSGVCPWCGAGFTTTDTILLVFFGLLVLAGVIVLVIWAVRAMGDRHAEGSPPVTAADDAALKTARERFARGEIDRAQYDEIVQALKG